MPPDHPLLAYVEAHDLTRKAAAKLLGLTYLAFRQIVTGHRRVSWDVAVSWETTTRKVVSARRVMEWQRIHSKRSAA